MTEFVPLQQSISAPVDGQGAPTSAAAPQKQYAPWFQARAPISTTIDLNTMDPAPVPATVYERDFFLTHAFEGSVQRLFMSASEDAEQQEFTITLVDGDGNALTEPRTFTSLPDRAEVIADTAAVATAESLYLRVKTTAQDVLLYVTADVLLDEVEL